MTSFAWLAIAYYLFCQIVWTARWWAWYNEGFWSMVRSRNRANQRVCK